MEIRSQLRVLVFGGPGSMIYTNLATPHLELDAINYLRDIGALEDLGTGTYPVTAYGREHWGKLTAPRWYWFSPDPPKEGV